MEITYTLTRTHAHTLVLIMLIVSARQQKHVLIPNIIFVTNYWILLRADNNSNNNNNINNINNNNNASHSAVEIKI